MNQTTREIVALDKTIQWVKAMLKEKPNVTNEDLDTLLSLVDTKYRLILDNIRD